MPSQIREKLNTPADYELFIAIKRSESLLVRNKNILSPKKRLQSFWFENKSQFLCEQIQAIGHLH